MLRGASHLLQLIGFSLEVPPGFRTTRGAWSTDLGAPLSAGVLARPVRGVSLKMHLGCFV